MTIEAAKAELESYLKMDAERAAKITMIWHTREILESSTAPAPNVENRKGYRYEEVKNGMGLPTGKRRRVEAFVPCPIAVQTQRNPERREDLFARLSELEYEYKMACEKACEISMTITAKIHRVKEPFGTALYRTYILGETQDKISMMMNNCCIKTVRRNRDKGIEIYAGLEEA